MKFKMFSPTPQHNNIYTGGHDIYFFVDAFFVIITKYLVFLMSVKSREQGFFKTEIKHFYYMTHMAMPVHKDPWPRGYENYGKLSLGHHYYILSLYMYDPCSVIEMKIFEKVMYFHYMTYCNALSRGSRNLQFWQTLHWFLQLYLSVF